MERMDLHTHSRVSDGSMTPGEVIAEAKAAGLSAVSLTDHDETAGLEEALEAGKRLDLRVIPGIELSAQGETEVHVLGYWPDTGSRVFREALAEIRACRRKRMEVTADLCAENGMPITVEDAEEFAGGSMLCRAHFANVMVARGYVSCYQEAFRKWLGNGRPCHYDLQVFDPEGAVRLLKEAGAVVCIAHLNQLKMPDDRVRAFLESLLPAGLDGIEGWYTEYTPEQEKSYQTMASELGLVMSGGTDFHGSMKPHIAIGKGLGNLEIPLSALAELEKRRIH